VKDDRSWLSIRKLSEAAESGVRRGKSEFLELMEVRRSRDQSWLSLAEVDGMSCGRAGTSGKLMKAEERRRPNHPARPGKRWPKIIQILDL